MEFENVAKKIMLATACVSVVIAIACVLYFQFGPDANVGYAIPFVVGILIALCANLTKVILLKRSIISVTQMDVSGKASTMFQLKHFARLLLTAGVLLFAALMPEHIISLMGTVFGILAYPVALFFVRAYVQPDPYDAEAAKKYMPYDDEDSNTESDDDNIKDGE